MTAIELARTSTELHTAEILPWKVIDPSESMRSVNFCGILWAKSVKLFTDLAADHKSIPNTTKKDLLNGDFGGIFLDDGYWLVCHMDRRVEI